MRLRVTRPRVMLPLATPRRVMPLRAMHPHAMPRRDLQEIYTPMERAEPEGAARSSFGLFR
jgi:hypothetical protein